MHPSRRAPSLGALLLLTESVHRVWHRRVPYFPLEPLPPAPPSPPPSPDRGRVRISGSAEQRRQGLWLRREGGRLKDMALMLRAFETATSDDELPTFLRSRDPYPECALPGDPRAANTACAADEAAVPWPPYMMTKRWRAGARNKPRGG